MVEKNISSRIHYKVGDIVKEESIIVPPDRECWIGVIVEVAREYYQSYTWISQTEDLVSIYWFQSGVVEDLPSSVILLVQRRDKKHK